MSARRKPRSEGYSPPSDFPVILCRWEYWRGPTDWTEGPMSTSGKIAPEDIDLLFITDNPSAAVRRVVENFRKHVEKSATAHTL